MQQSYDPAFRALGVGAAICAGMAARAALKATWTTVTKRDPPLNPASRDTAWKEALIWATLTGATVGVARLAARRLAAEGWHKMTGSYPAGFETSEPKSELART